jgi:microcin C transport system permease protein
MNKLIMKFLSAPNQRRWRVFTSQRRAQFGMTVFFTILIISMTSEIWSNHRPLVFVRDVPISEGATETERRWFFPALKDYSASQVGEFGSFVVDFKDMVKTDREQGKNTTAIFPPNTWDPYIQTETQLGAPSREHWLGTDNLGRDVTARLLYGIRVSLMYGLIFWLATFLIGIVVGAIQGYLGGSVDFITERVKELFEIIPFLSTVILINGLMKDQSSFMITLLVVVVLSWVSIASQLRAQFLSLRRRDFCEAARAMGAGRTRIIFKHILPNALTPILTLTPFTIASGITILAILDYLGFGMNPPTPSLGELLSQGRQYITNAPWILITPTAALTIMLISINLIGEALREAFDPKKSLAK